MKVLHVVNLYPTARYPGNGVFVKEQIEDVGNFVKCDVYFINRKEKGLKEYWKAIWALRRRCREYDLVHAHQLLAGAVCCLVAEHSKLVVSILSSGNDAIGWPKVFGDLVFNMVCSRAERLIFKCPPPRKWAGKAVYLPNGVDESRFKPIGERVAKQRLGLDAGKRYVLFVSANSIHRPEKRYDFYRSVMSSLERRYPEEKWAELVVSRSSRESMPYYYAAASVHLLPSDREGSPNSVKEALASGCPVVAREVGDLRSLIGDVDGCVLFHDDHPEDVADRVREAAKTADRWAIRRAFLKKGLTKERVRDALLNVYKGLMDGRAVR